MHDSIHDIARRYCCSHGVSRRVSNRIGLGCLPYATGQARALGGGYYTYICGAIDLRVGFLAAWLYFLYDPVPAGFVLPYIGSVLEQACGRGASPTDVLKSRDRRARWQEGN